MNIRFDKTTAFIALPPVFIIIAAVLALHIPFDSVISDTERDILNFMPSPLKIVSRALLLKKTDSEGPFDFADARPSGVHDSPRDGQKPETHVSLIVISGENKMAVIDGRTVKEGDRIGGMKIAKIEPDRILLQNRSSQWLYIKDE